MGEAQGEAGGGVKGPQMKRSARAELVGLKREIAAPSRRLETASAKLMRFYAEFPGGHEPALEAEFIELTRRKEAAEKDYLRLLASTDAH